MLHITSYKTILLITFNRDNCLRTCLSLDICQPGVGSSCQFLNPESGRVFKQLGTSQNQFESSNFCISQQLIGLAKQYTSSNPDTLVQIRSESNPK